MVGLRNNTAETARAAFTLIELLAVVAIIGLLSIATVASYQAIANDVRRAGAVEQVKSMLAKARMRALSDARATALIFRPVLTAPGVQQIEGMLAQFSGDAFRYVPEDVFVGVQSKPIAARFLPVDSGKPMLLSEGIGVASPCHRLANVDAYDLRLDLDGDQQYLTVSNLAGILPEAPGVIIGVVFARDGSQTVLLPEAGADWLWVDFNGDGAQRYDGDDYCNRPEESGFNPPPACPPDLADIEAWSPPAAGCWLGTLYFASNGNPSPSADLWDDDERLPMCQRVEKDEPIVLVAPYLAIYDDRDAREELDPQRWLDTGANPLRRAAAARRGFDMSTFIDENARQLHFNPNTGVVHEGASR